MLFTVVQIQSGRSATLVGFEANPSNVSRRKPAVTEYTHNARADTANNQIQNQLYAT